MNKLINKFLLTRDKLMLDLHLKQPGFNCSTCGPFTNSKFKEKGNSKPLK